MIDGTENNKKLKKNENSFGVLVFYSYVCINIKNENMVNHDLVNKMNYIGDVMKAHNIDYKFDAEHCSIMILIEHMYELLSNTVLIPKDLWDKTVVEFNNAQYIEAKSVVDELIK